MADLSPAARKILISYWVHHRSTEPTDSQKVAAVLRAAVRNVWTAEDILAVADELDPFVEGRHHPSWSEVRHSFTSPTQESLQQPCNQP
jgi:hypothetical protein